MSHFISNLRQEAKHIPVAERVTCAPSKDKEHTLDINASRLFFEKPELHAVGCSILGRGAEPLVRTQFLEHPPTLNFGANRLKKWIQHPQKPPIPFLSPHNPHCRGGFFGVGQRVRAQLEQS